MLIFEYLIQMAKWPYILKGRRVKKKKAQVRGGGGGGSLVLPCLGVGRGVGGGKASGHF